MTYDLVFLSFQGEDTRDNFVSHLHKVFPHIEKVECLDASDVSVVGIWGMGGIGKTTIAKAVFDRLQELGKIIFDDGRSHLKEVANISGWDSHVTRGGMEGNNNNRSLCDAFISYRLPKALQEEIDLLAFVLPHLENMKTETAASVKEAPAVSIFTPNSAALHLGLELPNFSEQVSMLEAREGGPASVTEWLPCLDDAEKDLTMAELLQPEGDFPGREVTYVHIIPCFPRRKFKPYSYHLWFFPYVFKSISNWLHHCKAEEIIMGQLAKLSVTGSNFEDPIQLRRQSQNTCKQDLNTKSKHSSRNLDDATKDLMMEKILRAAGALRGRDVAAKKLQESNREAYLESRKPPRFAFQLHSTLVAATLLVTMTFLAALRPSSELLKVELINSSQTGKQGTPITDLFVLFNSAAFISLIVLIFSITQKLSVQPWFLFVEFSIVGAYVCSVMVVTPHLVAAVLLIGGFILLVVCFKFLGFHKMVLKWLQ